MTLPVLHHAGTGTRSGVPGHLRRYGRSLSHLAARRAVADWLRADGRPVADHLIDVRHRSGAAPTVLLPDGATTPSLRVSVSHVPGQGVALAGRACALGVDLVEADRFRRFAETPERRFLQRRLVGSTSSEISTEVLRRIAAVKEAIGKAVDARAAGLSWLDVSLGAADTSAQEWPLKLAIDGEPPIENGRFEVAAMAGAWSWWVLPDGTGLAVAGR